MDVATEIGTRPLPELGEDFYQESIIELNDIYINVVPTIITPHTETPPQRIDCLARFNNLLTRLEEYISKQTNMPEDSSTSLYLDIFVKIGLTIDVLQSEISNPEQLLALTERVLQNAIRLIPINSFNSVIEFFGANQDYKWLGPYKLVLLTKTASGPYFNKVFFPTITATTIPSYSNFKENTLKDTPLEDFDAIVGLLQIYGLYGRIYRTDPEQFNLSNGHFIGNIWSQLKNLPILFQCFWHIYDVWTKIPTKNDHLFMWIADMILRKGERLSLSTNQKGFTQEERH